VKLQQQRLQLQEKRHQAYKGDAEEAAAEVVVVSVAEVVAVEDAVTVEAEGEAEVSPR
jgi:hypothetical protein